MRDDKSEIDLISQVLQGDKTAYAQIIKQHQRFVFTLALRFSKCREDAEEIAQDSFIKAFRALPSFKQNSKFSTWLYSIVYTTSMTFLRKKRLDTQSIDDETSLIQLEAYSSDHTVIDVEHKSKMQFVNLAISQLSTIDSAIITLFYQGEQSLEEIAQALGMESNTVKVKLHRARQRLREKIEGILKQEVRDLL